jgi:hypothetical protein
MSAHGAHCVTVTVKVRLMRVVRTVRVAHGACCEAGLGSGNWRRRFHCFTGPQLRDLVPGKVLATPFVRRVS